MGRGVYAKFWGLMFLAALVMALGCSSKQKAKVAPPEQSEQDEMKAMGNEKYEDEGVMGSMKEMPAPAPVPGIAGAGATGGGSGGGSGMTPESRYGSSSGAGQGMSLEEARDILASTIRDATDPPMRVNLLDYDNSGVDDFIFTLPRQTDDSGELDYFKGAAAGAVGAIAGNLTEDSDKVFIINGDASWVAAVAAIAQCYQLSSSSAGSSDCATRIWKRAQ